MADVRINLTINPASVAGPKGDPFEYSDFTPAQLEALRGPRGYTGAAGEKGDKGDPFEYSDFTAEQLEALRGPAGAKGDKGDKGDPFEYADFTAEQLAALQGPAGENGSDGISPTVGLVREDDGVTISVTDAGGTKTAKVYDGEGGGGGVDFTTDETLTLDPVTKVLSVNRADSVEEDNTLPITSAAVYATVGGIETLLSTI